MEKEKRCRHFKCHFGDDDIVIGTYRFNNVHELPEECQEGQEIDFYLDTGDDIYLLRLRNNSKQLITFVDGEIIYIIIEKQISNDINLELYSIYLELKNHGIPCPLEGSVSFPYPVV